MGHPLDPNPSAISAAIRRCAWVFTMTLAVAGLPAAASEPLDLEGRIACREAIEQVAWRHRIWPSTNLAPKPSLSEVLPQAALRQRVERSILLSNALERYWHRPVGAAELAAELRRIFRDSRDPERLAEIVTALDGDGYRLAECVARPLLAERLARSFYAADPRFGAGKGRPSFDKWLASVQSGLELELVTEPADWKSWALPLAAPKGPKGTNGDFWVPTAALPEATSGETAVWTGSEMIVWGGGGRDTGSRYDPATDTWTPTAAIGAPAPRTDHTAVWTGSEMIIYGGCGQTSNFCEIATGGRYDPATDSWTPIAPSWSADAPSSILPRRRHTAVWTGSEMIVWGGCRTGSNGNNGCGINLSAGGRYDLGTNSWHPVSSVNEPVRRKGHTAIWTGSEMIVWGGHTGISVTDTGGRYNPALDLWTPTTTAGAPAPRSGHTTVWTGTEMIVWGGCNNSLCTGGTTRFGDGGRYDPAADTWQPVSTDGAPDPRADHTAVWTGKEGMVMIVWGGAGQDGLPRNTGGLYFPAFDAWKETGTAGAPAPRSDHRAVWTGTEMIVWGRAPQGIKSGGRYDPSSDSWVPTSVNDPRRPRGNHLAVWTGSEMLLWGGNVGGGLSGAGDRYDPATDSWTPMSDSGEPLNREHGAEGVWTGQDMIVWGGQTGTSVFGTGGRYNPATDTWRPTATANAPLPRAYHAMTWTGTRMFVWGGVTSTSSVTATGGLYDPASDTWTPTNLSGAPAARRFVPAVWTGSRVIVWGGWDGSVDLDSGGVYDPSTDSWTATSMAGAPAPRHFHTALWTGSRLLVWGGMQGTLDNGIYLASGGLYDPTTGAWTPTTLAGAPSGRIWHAEVWTGREMIVWGGCNGPSPCARGQFTGARYDPALDAWAPTPLQSAPGARDQHSGVWTGSALIVWGGYADTYGSYTSTGGLYYPPPPQRPFR